MNTVEPSVAGPKRPQDRLALSLVAEQFQTALTRARAPKPSLSPRR